MVKVGVLVSGRGSNLQALIDAADSGRLDASIEVVISDRPGAQGLERAERAGIPAVVVDRKSFNSRDEFEAAVIEKLSERGVELVVLAGFMRVLGPKFIDAFPARIMNIHPSLLPAFRGLDVQKRAIDYGVRFSGCTVHFVDRDVDTGPIIIQAVVPVLDGDTPETLAERILGEEHRILPQAVQLFAEGRLAIEGRRVIVRDHRTPAGTLENPVVTIFD